VFYKHCNGTHINRSQAEVSLNSSVFIHIHSYDIVIRLVLVNKSLSAQCTFSNMIVFYLRTVTNAHKSSINIDDLKTSVFIHNNDVIMFQSIYI